MVVNVPWTNTQNTYLAATAGVLGLSKLSSNTAQTVAANTPSTTSSRTYGVQHNADDQLVVNVPWTNTNTQLSQEEVEDFVGGMIGTQSGITVSYVDDNANAGKLTFDVNKSITFLSNAAKTISVGGVTSGAGKDLTISAGATTDATAGDGGDLKLSGGSSSAGTAGIVDITSGLTISSLSSGPLEVDGDGVVSVGSYTTNTNTTYSGGTNISLSGTTFNLDNNITLQSITTTSGNDLTLKSKASRAINFRMRSTLGDISSVFSTSKAYRSITSSTDGTKLAAVVYGGYIWTSSNSGATWTSRDPGNNNAFLLWLDITSSTDGTKLAAVAYGNLNGGIWTSTDSGANWTSRASSKNWYGITSSANGTKLAAVVRNGNIWTSTDSGANWTSRASSKNWYGITSSADGTKLAATVNGGNIWTSNDSGVNWTSRASTKDWYGITSSADGTKLAATVNGGHIWTSNDSGVTWTEDTSVGATKDWYGITSSEDGTNGLQLVAVVNLGHIFSNFKYRGNLMGIDSPSPIGTLTIGDGSSGSVPSQGNMIVIGGTNGAGARRWLGMTVDSDYMLSFGDCGIGTSTKSSLDKKAFRIQFRAPDNTLVVGGGTNGDKVGVGIGESSPGTKLVISHTFPTVPASASELVSVADAIESGITFKSDLNSASLGVWTRVMQKVARIYWQPLYFNDVGSGYGGNHGNLCFTANAFNSPASAYPAMVINTVGNVGIGTTSPSYPLEVSGQTPAASIGTYAQFYMGTGIGPPFAATGTSTTSPDVSIYAEKSIWTGKRLLSTSDERIKENITEVPDNLALQMLRDIDCNYYEYKDKISSGTQQTIGFIAQQVKEHLSIAVSIKKSIIPNEMRVLEATWDGLNMSSDLTDVSGVKYKFYVSNDPSGNDEVKKEIVGNEDNTFTFDKHYNNVFCYGKEVDDFHTLDKQKLFTVNFSATQEIDKIQQEEKTKLAAAEERITALETENASLKAQLNSIEARLAALEA